MIVAAPPLKYLFVARFVDGSTFEQNPEDRSTLVEGKSAFSDLLELAKRKQLESFFLVGNGHVYAVDLRDGHFEVDGHGHLFWAGDVDLPARPVVERELVYFRRRSLDFVLGAGGWAPPGDGGTTRFFFGWRAVVDGREVRSVLGIF